MTPSARFGALRTACRAWREELRGFDWNDIGDPQSIGTWPAAIRALVVSVLFCGCVGAGFWFLLKQRQLELQRVVAVEAGLRADLDAKAAVAAELDVQRVRTADLDAAFAALLSRLPGQTGVPGLLDDITVAGLASGLRFDAIQLQREVELGFYLEQPIDIRASGNYHQLGAFVSMVAALPRIVTLHDFSIQASAGREELSLSIVASTYRYRAGEAGQQGGMPADLAREPVLIEPFTYSAAALRSPFSLPLDSDSGLPGRRDLIQPDFARVPGKLEAFSLDALRMVGILSRGGQRWALVRDASGEISRVSIGAYIGRDHGRIVQIGETGIEVMELVRAGDGGWIERSQTMLLQQ